MPALRSEAAILQPISVRSAFRVEVAPSLLRRALHRLRRRSRRASSSGSAYVRVPDWSPPRDRLAQDVGGNGLGRVLRQRALPELCAPARTPERQLGALLAGRVTLLVEDVDLVPARPRIGQQAARRQGHE